MSGRKRRPPEDGTRELLLAEAWSLIRIAIENDNLAVASATLERAARIAGVWSDKPGPVDPAGPPPTQVFTCEPMTAEQWSDKFLPRD